MPLGVPVVTFSIQGRGRIRNKLGQFAVGDILAQAGAVEEIEAVGRDYENRLSGVFAAKHGRTGETAQSIAGELVAAPEAVGYAVSIAGNIGFVINPLPSHVIDLVHNGPAMALSNRNTSRLHRGRRTNFYSEFGPRVSVVWFQLGGDESYNPDPQWYREAQPLLDEEGAVALNKLGVWVANFWGAESIMTTQRAGSL